MIFSGIIFIEMKGSSSQATFSLLRLISFPFSSKTFAESYYIGCLLKFILSTRSCRLFLYYFISSFISKIFSLFLYLFLSLFGANFHSPQKFHVFFLYSTFFLKELEQLFVLYSSTDSSAKLILLSHQRI